MNDIHYENLGGLERKPDPRDFPLGAAQIPAPRPPVFLPDNSWMQRNYQGQTPYCGAHSASHFKALLDFYALTLKGRKTPRYIWTEIKTFDGYPMESGTDMRSIFKALQQFGAADYEPLENDVTLPIADYSDPKNITPVMLANGKQSLIGSYAFGATDFDSLCQYVYQNKAVLLLIKADEGFWHTKTPTFTIPKYGHFIVADGYDASNIRVIDSADPDDANAVKMVDKRYLQPQFFIESGTAVELPPSVHAALSAGQISLAQQILADLAKILHLDQNILTQRSHPSIPS